MFSIHFDDESLLLTARLEGYWDMETYKAYETELFRTEKSILQRHGHFKMLVDTENYPVQSADVSEAFQRNFADFASRETLPIAIVAASMLNKQQVKRIFPYPNVHVFWNVEDARQWLLEEADRPSRGELGESVRPH